MGRHRCSMPRVPRRILVPVPSASAEPISNSSPERDGPTNITHGRSTQAAGTYRSGSLATRSGDLHSHDASEVLAHDGCDDILVKVVRQVVEVALRLGQAFRMRIVGSE